MSNLLIRIIRAYRKSYSGYSLLSSLGIVSPQCRFEPTCSHYAEMAIQKHGPLKGSLKSIYRVIRCNPFSKGGIDLP